MKLNKIALVVVGLTLVSARISRADDVDDQVQSFNDGLTGAVQGDGRAKLFVPIIQQEFIDPANQAIQDDRDAGSLSNSPSASDNGASNDNSNNSDAYDNSAAGGSGDSDSAPDAGE